MSMASFWSKVKDEHFPQQGEILFISKIDKKITVRIQAEGVEDTNWFRQFYTEYQGNRSENFAIRCLHLEKGEGTAKATPIILVVRPSIHNRIFGMLCEEIDLLSPKEGFPITVTKEGTGLNTKYDVMLIPKPFDTSGYEQKDIDAAVGKLTKPKEKKENNFGKQAEKVTEEPISLEEEGDDDIPF